MPKKLTLKVDELRVVQFQVQQSEAPIRGTVRGFTGPGVGCTIPSDVYVSECMACDQGYITYVGCE